MRQSCTAGLAVLQPTIVVGYFKIPPGRSGGVAAQWLAGAIEKKTVVVGHVRAHLTASLKHVSGIFPVPNVEHYHHSVPRAATEWGRSSGFTINMAPATLVVGTHTGVERVEVKVLQGMRADLVLTDEHPQNILSCLAVLAGALDQDWFGIFRHYFPDVYQKVENVD